MKAYIVEIRTPFGAIKKKGLIAKDEADAASKIRYLQSVSGRDGKPQCVRGTIEDVYPRPHGKPMPQVMLTNPQILDLAGKLR
jgi:hypothetical protein